MITGTRIQNEPGPVSRSWNVRQSLTLANSQSSGHSGFERKVVTLYATYLFTVTCW